MWKTIKKHPHYLLILALPLALVGEILHWSDVSLFVLAILGIVPLAKLLGEATEALAVHTGPRIGGLMNATLGNAAELIITVMALRAGLLDLVKASITGSIIGNILVVMGGAILLGGLRHGVQRFDRTRAGISATQLTLTIIALAIPSLFAQAIEPNHMAVEQLSASVAVIMMVIYILGLIFGLRENHVSPAVAPPHAVAEARWNVREALLVLALATGGIVWLSELLVGVVEATIAALSVSEFFIGIIIVPLIGNAAEHLVAITAAMKNEMDLSMEIALGSSIQIALFVAPLLVFISFALAPQHLTLVFHPFELAALAAGTFIAALIAQDGESNWMEGVQLVGVYLIIAIAFFFLPV